MDNGQQPKDRRSNSVHAAFIEAGLTIRELADLERAILFLVREGVQDDTIKRVLIGDGQRRRREVGRTSPVAQPDDPNCK